ncbi:lipoprotein signal peptidase [Sinisalibacter aestuarii]|uniref:Lipoprotein signal peptidase n=2 Tax=Sinisalibacter aestuarii TaxID=2949426 RepID=A0ABQ5LP85_9RHOB|nr:lipoprotein signal peptidase [Sinisalibacter aestuarii]
MALAGGLTLALDQITKAGVVHLLDLKTRGQIDVLPPFLTFRMAWNRGVNFGLGASDHDVMRWVLIGVALIISALLIWWARRDGFGRAAQIFAGLLVGGAIGNVIDRVLYGAVADFLNMSCCGIVNPWSFNVADIGVFLGAVGLALFSGTGKSGQ